MKKTKFPVVEDTDMVVLALIVDKENKKERVLIGSELGIQYRLDGRTDVEVIFDQVRPLGKLIWEHDGQDRGWWCAEVFTPLRNALQAKKRDGNEQAALNVLREKMNSSNAVSLFFACRALSCYLSTQYARRNADDFVEEMLVLVASCRKTSLRAEEFTLEKAIEIVDEKIQFAISSDERHLRTLHSWRKFDQEFVMAEKSMLPLLHYYLYRLEDWGMCFRICAVCGMKFVAESGHYSLCGDKECERVQNRLNKRTYDERTQPYEKTYQQIRDALKKKLNKFLDREDVTAEPVNHAQKTYASFRAEAKFKKKSVKTDKEKSEFVTWLFEQERYLDELYGGDR